ncbi:MAG: hypothetical protein JO162_09045 [Alphaproteobacteria bacterium]|nr:hypothetical protein [Alphaproteobacteria bacterium]MBV9016652.1 hypothetical protein [Alphaproteobacteria bacterium]MBV9587872.1 hypothetical protein [Alphaproteobacteria bacterium]MBV9966334.1 hypothetical protein [Alphaproteobacteria bacterium]
MKKHLFVAAAALLLAGATAVPVQAQMSVNDVDATSVSCGAFARWGAGGWTVTSPTVMDFDNGSSMRLAPGMSFGPGTTQGGVAIPVILDRHCGNL